MFHEDSHTREVTLVPIHDQAQGENTTTDKSNGKEDDMRCLIIDWGQSVMGIIGTLKVEVT